MKTIQLEPKLEELITLNKFIQKETITDRTDIELIIEEVFVNIVNYSGCSYIIVSYEVNDNNITIEFRDDGVKFNPLQKKQPKMPNSIEEAKIGGLGIHIVKTLVDNISYEFFDDENILTITKNVKK